jgi:hypothetical protein
MDNNKQDIYTLEQNLIEELNDNKEEILESKYDLLKVAQSDLTLGYVHDSDIGEGDVYFLLSCSIRERLTNIGWNWLNQQVEVA